jgi:diphthine synthase
MNAVGAAGLSLYRYGETVSLVFFTPAWRPDSFYDRVKGNREKGLHTLVLLDIKVKEPTEESLARGRPVYLPPRFMTAAVAARQLLEIEEARGEGAYGPDTTAVAVARCGAGDQRIVCSTLRALADGEGEEACLGPPLHSLILAGEVHPLEEELLAGWRVAGGGGE